MNICENLNLSEVISISDILAVLFGKVMHHHPENPQWEDRDRFVLGDYDSIGVYATLAETGYFPTKWLKGYHTIGSNLSELNNKNEIKTLTESFVRCISVGVGQAYAAKVDKKGCRVYVLMSFREFMEETNQKILSFAVNHRLSNLIVIVGYKKDDYLTNDDNTINLLNFAEKWRSIGWKVVEVDCHEHGVLCKQLDIFPKLDVPPTCVIVHAS